MVLSLAFSLFCKMFNEFCTMFNEQISPMRTCIASLEAEEINKHPGLILTREEDVFNLPIDEDDVLLELRSQNYQPCPRFF